MGLPRDGNTRPEALPNVDVYFGDLWIAGKEVLAKPLAEVLDLSQRLLAGESINRVLDSVGGEDFAVVAACIDGIEVPLKSDVNGDVFQLVLLPIAGDTHQPYAGLTVTICNEFRSHQDESQLPRYVE